MAKVFMKKAGLAFGKDASLDDLLEALGKAWPRARCNPSFAPAQGVEAEAQVKAQIAAIKAQSASAGWTAA